MTDSRKKAPAHSFRHAFINSLKQNRADPTVIQELVGQSQGALSLTLTRYGGRYEPQILLAEFSKLNLGVEGELKGLPRWEA